MNKIKNNKKTILISVVFLLLIGALLKLYYDWNRNYRNNLRSGITIGKIDLSGLTAKQAEDKIDAEASRLESSGLQITYDGQQITLPSIISVNTDLSFPVFIYDRDETLKKVLEKSQQDSFLSYLSNIIKGAFTDQNIDMTYSFDEERARSYIVDNLKDVEIKPLNAAFAVKKRPDRSISFTIDPERVGRQIDFDLAFSNINERLKYLQNEAINLKTITSRPSVHAADLEALMPAAESLVQRGDLKITVPSATTTSWTVKKELLASWITIEGEPGNYRLSLDTEKIAEYLKSEIAPDVDQETKKPRYEISNGKVSSWQAGTEGKKINTEDGAIKVKEIFIIEGRNEIELATEIVDSGLTEDTDTFKIQEIIGTGHSNFAGSSANRRHNIKTGADAVNGLLIAPGEEFSLVKALGEIDAASGYLPELVIKNNKTIPEYGGGLCQVGTTMFRSALQSGLPITARQNHSYRVSYYEPAGTDAAIYDPWPDVRFLNDTGNYVLIQSRIVKDDIYFDFWGKKDGRIASSTAPTIYNIVKPAPTKIVETDELKPGEKKCTEKAHNGADAYFDYSVTYASGDIKTNRFKSHYVPWQEVCLIGKSPTSTPEIASSTPAAATTTAKTN